MTSTTRTDSPPSPTANGSIAEASLAAGGVEAGAADQAPARPVPRRRAHGEPGVLLVLEGIDGSGRSTHARLLEQHLRYQGRGVTRTSIASSVLAGDPIRAAKARGRIHPVTLALLYAADLSERLDTVILPSLRAGLVVLADRYVATPMARAEARGVDRAWLSDLFAFAPAPDASIYLHVSPATALERRNQPPDPFEAGLDAGAPVDLNASFERFQTRLAACFDAYADAEALIRVPVEGPIARVGAIVSGIADRAMEREARGEDAATAGPDPSRR